MSDDLTGLFKISDAVQLSVVLERSVKRAVYKAAGDDLTKSMLAKIMDAIGDAVPLAVFYSSCKISRRK